MIEGPYLRDILGQPEALAATLRGLQISPELERLAARVREGCFRRIVLTGMGASFHALYPLFLRLNQRGHTALVVETSELVHSLAQWLEPETLLVAVSQSGESAEIVRLASENCHRAALVAVTNGAASPLARQAEALLLMQAGSEFSVSCKTYVTALMALHWLGGLLCGDDEATALAELSQAAPAADSYLVPWRENVAAMAAELGDVRHLFLLGRGASLAAAGEGALIFKESVRIHAEGMSGAAFRHGPLEMLNGETFAVVFAGAGATRTLQARLRDDLRRMGCATAWIQQDAVPASWNIPAAPAGIVPILEILPVQMLTLALAANAGIEAGRFARVAKITSKE
jgi:glucosamine--fructose-6-phosphate aminotransferase (isomerizing)